MKFNDGKTISAYVRSKLHSGYITMMTNDEFKLATFPMNEIQF